MTDPYTTALNDILGIQSNIKEVIVKDYEKLLERLEKLAFYSPDFRDRRLIEEQKAKLEQFIDELGTQS